MRDITHKRENHEGQDMCKEGLQLTRGMGEGREKQIQRTNDGRSPAHLKRGNSGENHEATKEGNELPSVRTQHGNSSSAGPTQRPFSLGGTLPFGKANSSTWSVISSLGPGVREARRSAREASREAPEVRSPTPTRFPCLRPHLQDKGTHRQKRGI